MNTVIPSPIQIAVVGSDPLRYLGFRAFLSADPEFEVRACTIPEILRDLRDEVILMTTDSGPGFFAAMSALRVVRPTVRVLVTGPGSLDEDVLRAISGGAKGFIREDAGPDEFKRAIRAVHSGSVWAPGRVLSTFIERATASARKMHIEHDDDKISGREREVLRLLVSGLSNREIGEELGILERTVKAHVAQLMRKVGGTQPHRPFSPCSNQILTL
jgi:DNA-binding NarL/FixJ family response regulator